MKDVIALSVRQSLKAALTCFNADIEVLNAVFWPELLELLCSLSSPLLLPPPLLLLLGSGGSLSLPGIFPLLGFLSVSFDLLLGAAFPWTRCAGGGGGFDVQYRALFVWRSLFFSI